jgi:hypothetical protein
MSYLQTNADNGTMENLGIDIDKLVGKVLQQIDGFRSLPAVETDRSAAPESQVKR